MLRGGGLIKLIGQYQKFKNLKNISMEKTQSLTDEYEASLKKIAQLQLTTRKELEKAQVLADRIVVLDELSKEED
jgi:hypothetical protein